MSDLSGDWELTDETGAHALMMRLPGDGVSALCAAEIIPDPYHGHNEEGLRWIAERDWTASRSFDHPGGAAVLVIDGLDCVAEVRVNGGLVLSAANAYRCHRVPVLLQPGANRIAILFRSPVSAAAERAAVQPFPVPWIHWNSPLPHGNMLRKPAMDFGWDWNPALGNFGIWTSIRLEVPGPRIADVVIEQSHSPGRADLSVLVSAEGIEVVTVTLCGVTATAPVRDGMARLEMTIPEPELWWPVGLGPQVLHEMRITGGGVMATRRIGLRDLKLVSEADAVGRSFGFRVNGHDVFARGANWIPADALPGRITTEGARGLLQSAVDANMNMLRIWGGGRYEPDWFYDLCDEMGLMVWQDFMFSCHLYPADPAYLAEVDAEVREAVARIGHHACLAVWCGDNELIGALTWYPESRQNRDRYLVAYDRLNRTIEAGLRAVMPGANWWPSSPSPGPMSFGDAWHDDSAGDMHFWSVWHEGRDFDHYRDVTPRFCSEFGFQSYPSLSVIRHFAEPQDMNIAAPVMEAHQKNTGGNARIAETMFRYFRFPVDFANFVWLSQIQQGLAIHTAVTGWRGQKPRCQGALYWQLNDSWPGCSWSSLDHGGGWKLLHHMARRFYAPVTVVCAPEGGDLVLRAVNDTLAPVRLSVAAGAADMAGGLRPIDQTAVEVPVGAAVEILRIDAAALGAQEVLLFDWSGDAAGHDLYAPRPWKALDLRPSGLAAGVAPAGQGWRITLSAQALALFATVEADRPGRFSDNAVVVLPGRPVTLEFLPDRPGAMPRFTLRDLHSATYGTPSGQEI